MEKFFAALREQHPGFEVVDVRFLAERTAARDQDAGSMDADLADAVRSASCVGADAFA